MNTDQITMEAWEKKHGAAASRVGRTMLRFLPPDGVFLDIGANMGLCTERVLRKLNARGYLFEPVPKYFERCRSRFSNRRNVTVEQLAVSDKSGTATLWVGTSNLGWNTLEGDKRGTEMQPIDVEMLPFDDYAERQGITRIDVIKIDVEGAEYRVLDGMRKTLARLERKPVILCEIGWGAASHPNWEREKAAFEWLIQNGFQRFHYNVQKTSEVIIYPEGYDKLRSWVRWGRNLF